MNAASRMVGWARRIEMWLGPYEKRGYWLHKWRITYAKGLMGPLIKRWIKDASVCVCVRACASFRFTHICLSSYIALRLTYVHARQTTVMTSCLSIETRRWRIRRSSAEAEKMRRMQDRLWRRGGGVGQRGARIGISISWEDYWAGFRWLVPAELHGPERWTYEGRREG